MPTDRTYPHGAHCWVDCETPDAEGSSRFYSELFGWELSDAVPADAPGSYLIATLDGDDVAAIAPSDGDGPASWKTYIAVEDADRAAGLVAAEGGHILVDAEDAGPGGRLAICTDPGGGEFRLWQARARAGVQRANEHGAWNFSSLHTSDPIRAAGFYGAVFGWETDLADKSSPDMWRLPNYGRHLAATGDPDIIERQKEVGAPPGFEDVIAVLSPDDAATTAYWQVIFSVGNCDEATAKAEELGAEILERMDSGWTLEARIRDPQGAELVLSQFTPPGG